MGRTDPLSAPASAPVWGNVDLAVAFDQRGVDSSPVPSWPTDPVEILRILYPLLLVTAGHLSAAGPRDDRDLVQDAIVEILVRHPNFEGVEQCGPPTRA